MLFSMKTSTRMCMVLQIVGRLFCACLWTALRSWRLPLCNILLIKHKLLPLILSSLMCVCSSCEAAAQWTVSTKGWIELHGFSHIQPLCHTKLNTCCVRSSHILSNINTLLLFCLHLKHGQEMMAQARVTEWFLSLFGSINSMRNLPDSFVNMILAGLCQD